jgi:hypothetical protein
VVAGGAGEIEPLPVEALHVAAAIVLVDDLLALRALSLADALLIEWIEIGWEQRVHGVLPALLRLELFGGAETARRLEAISRVVQTWLLHVLTIDALLVRATVDGWSSLAILAHHARHTAIAQLTAAGVD